MNGMLHFKCRGEWFLVNEEGNMTQERHPTFSEGWKFLGVSFHHWKNSIDLHFEEAKTNPTKLIGGLVWDFDHGSIRRWGGQYFGRLPRITAVYVEETPVNILVKNNGTK
jgi:hypothetical protein